MAIERQDSVSSIIGKVVSNKMQKTVVLMTQQKIKHKTYGKYVTRTSKYFAHDPENKCQIGDLVRIRESRPYSKKKTWEVVEIINK